MSLLYYRLNVSWILQCNGITLKLNYQPKFYRNIFPNGHAIDNTCVTILFFDMISVCYNLDVRELWHTK